MKITKLVVASHNAGKIAEIKTLLAPLKIEVQSAADLRLGDVEETGTTFEENAKLKAVWLTIRDYVLMLSTVAPEFILLVMLLIVILTKG